MIPMAALFARVTPSLALEVAGLSLLSAGAGTLHIAAGLITGGLGCVVMAWRCDK
jgi:hypothetical protein